MTVFQAVFLGIVQGVAEFLPISSSGHLSIFQNIFHLSAAGETDLLFDVLLHFGTLIAVFIVYFADIKSMVLEFLAMVRLRKLPEGEKKDPLSRRMILFLVIATLPLFLTLLFKDFVEGLYSNMFFIAAALMVTGVLLYVTDRFAKGQKDIKSATALDALLVGVSQMIATVPGLSRSGTTICVGMARGFERSFAVKFSFLLSIPAILGANVLTLAEAISEGIDVTLIPYYLAGMVTAAVFGYLAIRLLNRITRSNRFGAFAYYCFGAGLLTLILSLVA